MKYVLVEQFGDVDELKIIEQPTPDPGPGQVRVKLTSIGMNHAELMARRGEYKIASGDPPFTPGLEGGGVIDAVGEGVTSRAEGDRVILSADAPREAAGGMGGTYRTHYVLPAESTVPAPDEIPDDQLGAIWLPYLTAWGCLHWKQGIKPGNIVAMPAASSSVAMAAAQMVKRAGGTAIGLTTSPSKVDTLQQMPEAPYDHLVVTRNDDGSDSKWRRELKDLTDGHYVDVFFDPVAAGDYVTQEILALAQHGTIWIYGLLGTPDTVQLTPLIRKHGSIRGWALTELVTVGGNALEAGYEHILDGFREGAYRQHVDRTFALDDVRAAHTEMEKGQHIGKLVLTP